MISEVARAVLAEMETGLKTRVPPFIEIGEVVRISTENKAYMSRA